MCTLTIHRDTSEILATMNRDEALTRGPETPPSVNYEDHGAWVAPQDSDRGGTWMGANEDGVVACLLNAYLPGESLLPDTSGRFCSRGEIIPLLLAKGPASYGLTWLLETFDPEVYPSFTLLVTAPEGTTCLSWLRRGKLEVETIDSEWYIRSSSGWDSEEVAGWREEEFERWLESGCETVQGLLRFHLLQVEGEEDRSPLMRRDWSATRSVTQVSVRPTEGEVEMRYWPEPAPTSERPAVRLSLPLRAQDTPALDMKAT